MIELVISGGQSGADLAGNVWAQNNGIKTVIRAYEGFRTFYKEDQKLYDSFEKQHYDLSRFYDPAERLKARTLYNVRNSDATLIFVAQPIEKTKGSRVTARFCKEAKRYHHVINLEGYDVQSLIKFMNLANPKVLNIAGERFLDKNRVINFLIKYWEKTQPPADIKLKVSNWAPKASAKDFDHSKG